MRNIELKARLTDLPAARRTAAALAADHAGTLEQVDTYFTGLHGRLKLRETVGGSAQLVWYSRPDERGPKASDYLLVPTEAPEALKAALSAAWGVRCVVRKRREVYLWGNVRIHLDEVESLGAFLEFEAVLGEEVGDAAGLAQVEELTARFAIRPQDLLSGSYADMLSHE